MEEQKKVPPPVPSRQQRRSATLPPTEVSVTPQEQQEPTASTQIAEEYYEEEIPTEVLNGEPVTDQQVAPNHYRWYRVVVEGKEDDIIDFRVSRVLHAAAVNIYVNIPPTDTYPTKESHDWNPAKGVLYGPPGEYHISVEGIPSFIEKDDKYLVDPNSNWAGFDLYVEWSALDEKTKEVQKKIREQYTREKTGSVWASSYNKEISVKYEAQQKEYEEELRARENASVESEIKIDGTPVAAAYDIGGILGRGDFTVVKKVKSKNDGKEYALKIIDKIAAKEAAIDALVLKQQINILNSFQHKNIVPLKEHFDVENALVLVLELQEGGELISNLLASIEPYSEESARKIITQVLEVIDFLHSKSIIHKSLLPENILYSKKTGGDIKLTGFSLSQVSKDDKEFGISGGDPGFLAPELISQQEYGRPVDMWCIGVISYILLAGDRPFNDSNTIRLNSKIRQGSFEFPDQNWKSVSQEAKDFVKALLTVDPGKRLTAKQALAHSWIKKSGGNLLPHVKANLKSYNNA